MPIFNEQSDDRSTNLLPVGRSVIPQQAGHILPPNSNRHNKKSFCLSPLDPPAHAHNSTHHHWLARRPPLLLFTRSSQHRCHFQFCTAPLRTNIPKESRHGRKIRGVRTRGGQQQQRKISSFLSSHPRSSGVPIHSRSSDVHQDARDKNTTVHCQAAFCPSWLSCDSSS